MAGIGGAFGAREDLSMQAHACMLALRTGRPVKIVYGRAESFVGHVHRHPARMRYEHGATREGTLVYVKARIMLDGGAYASSSTAVIANACCFAVGPYNCPNATIDGAVRGGVGYAVGFKNVGYSEGLDDYSTARVKLSVVGGRPRVEVHTAAAEVGQGLVTVQAQIAGTELGVHDVIVLNADTQVGSAGSSSASRQTYITGGAVKAACEAMRERVLALAESELSELSRDGAGGSDGWRLENDAIVSAEGTAVITPATLLGEEGSEETREFRPRRTSRRGPDTGQAHAHLQNRFGAPRAGVDADTQPGPANVVH